MKINRHIHQTLRLKNLLITVLLLAFLSGLAWMSREYAARVDLSANADNTLSEASAKVLAKLSGPVTLKAYFDQPEIKHQIGRLLTRYQHLKSDIEIIFVDPTASPEQVREHNVGPQGALIAEYQGQSEKIIYPDEAGLTNALLQLAENRQRWLTFLTGHGERSLTEGANFDLGLFGTELEKRGIHAQSLNLAQVASIPDNSALLVLAGPSVELLSAELEMIADYIDSGGNLLLMTDPDNRFLVSIEQQLGLEQLPGKIVDARTGLYGIDDPTFILGSEYAAHPVTRGFKNITVFPICAALAFNADDSDYHVVSLLTSSQQSWTEIGEISGKIRFDADGEEREGPLTLAFALTRQLATDKQQRIVVVGDGDFLSNAYLNNVGNLDLGLRIVNWLTENDRFIDIPAKVTSGRTLQLSTTSIAMIGFGFLLVLPAAFLLCGFLIWRRRKNR